MAEVAALFAVETAIEGAVVGGLVASKSTVPLHVQFHKIKGPPADLAVQKATVSVIKSKAYIIGSDVSTGHAVDGVHVLSLPLDFGTSRVNGTVPVDVDYELVKPRPETGRPLQRESETNNEEGLWSRGAHAAATVGDKILIFGGRPSGTRKAGPSQLYEVLCFDTTRLSYSLLSADKDKCTEGTPKPRTVPSLTCSPLPQPSTGVVSSETGPLIDAHGTLFLHGGYDSQHQPLHDTWTFDIGTRVWHQFPSLPDELLETLKTPGRIFYTNSKLWYINNQIAAYLELAEHNPKEQMASDKASMSSTGRVGSGQWVVVAPSEALTGEEKSAMQHAYFSLVPITTGAGRQYLITFPRTNPSDLHSFQLESEPSTLAALKDSVRDNKIMPDSWRSGKHEWAACQIVHASKTDGPLATPAPGLTDYAIAQWDEHGDRSVIWGGEESGGEVRGEGWIVSFE